MGDTNTKKTYLYASDSPKWRKGNLYFDISMTLAIVDMLIMVLLLVYVKSSVEAQIMLIIAFVALGSISAWFSVRSISLSVEAFTEREGYEVHR